MSVRIVHGGPPARRERILAALTATGGVCLTTYGTVAAEAMHSDERGVLGSAAFDLLVLDEAHHIKNAHAKVSKVAHRGVEFARNGRPGKSRGWAARLRLFTKLRQWQWQHKLETCPRVSGGCTGNARAPCGAPLPVDGHAADE